MSGKIMTPKIVYISGVPGAGLTTIRRALLTLLEGEGKAVIRKSDVALFDAQESLIEKMKQHLETDDNGVVMVHGRHISRLNVQNSDSLLPLNKSFGSATARVFLHVDLETASQRTQKPQRIKSWLERYTNIDILATEDLKDWQIVKSDTPPEETLANVIKAVGLKNVTPARIQQALQKQAS